MNYDLPTSVEIGGIDYSIRSDFRAVLDIYAALNDPDLEQQDKAVAALMIFYPDFDSIPGCDFKEAVEKCLWFVNCGDEDTEQSKKQPRLVDWDQDFKLIIAPVNKVLGCEARGIAYDPETNTGGLHWWTFCSAYQEIGDCFFAQVVRIRDLKRRGKPLDKQDREFYRRNRDLIDMKTKYTAEEDSILDRWLK